MAIVTAMAVVTLNIWTGAPLLALWIGSRVQGGGPPTMGAVAVVVVSLLIVVLGLLRLLAALSAAHAIPGQHEVRRHVPWLRSMRGERESYRGNATQLTALDRTLVSVVVIAIAAFEIWFFFFSTSPIDQRSGRAAAPRPNASQPRLTLVGAATVAERGAPPSEVAAAQHRADHMQLSGAATGRQPPAALLPPPS